jgi:hypothetical protein
VSLWLILDDWGPSFLYLSLYRPSLWPLSCLDHLRPLEPPGL